MATIRKRGTRWQVQVRRAGGFHRSRSFIYRSDAERWARETEAEADRRHLRTDPAQLAKLKLHDILTRYRDSVTPRKRSADNERHFIATMLRRPIAAMRMLDLSPAAVAEYRDERLKTIKPASVLRELAIIQNALEIAMREWGVALTVNPCRVIAKPSPGPGKQRRLAADELPRLMAALDKTRNALLGPLVRFAIETGMRRSELLRLRWCDVNDEARTLAIPVTKNGHPRVIALSREALAILGSMQRSDANRIFPLTANALRLSWERLRRRAGVLDLRFHDLRHEAISRLFEKGLNLPEVAVMSGHRDPRMLLRYTHPRAEDIAAKLSEAERQSNCDSSRYHSTRGVVLTP